MSCNGCRVLRKGCSESCILRPCLQWIESADAQGHATVFVAKFFGRSGLMGFISAVPPNQRSAVFQSLLYEACGRTVNPVFGAVGLLWSGNWTACQAAVETVLKGGSLRPPSPSSLDAGMTSFPNFSVGNSSAVNLAGLMRSEKSCPTDTSGVSLSNEKSEWAKKAREMYIPSLNDPRCPSELMTAGSHQMQMQGAENNSNVESKAGPDMKGDSAESFSDLRDRHMWRYVATPNNNFPRLELPTVRIASRGLMGVEKQEQDERTDGPLVLAPVARRVRPRTDVPDLRAPSTVPVGRVENEEREKLELDLTLSSNVNATRQQRNGNGAGRAKGVKRVSSPNSSESVNSEGSVTSLDSTCDLSLSQVPDVWKSQKLGVGRPIGFHSPVCSPKALSLFASP